MIHINNHEHGRRIAAQYGSIYSKELHTVISRTENGELYGGSLFENFTGKGGSIAIHVGSFRKFWVNRDLLWMTFDYPFIQLGCNQVFGQVPAKNADAIKFNLSLGFKELVRIPSVFPDDDMILMNMVKEDCRALKLKPRDIKPNYHAR